MQVFKQNIIIQIHILSYSMALIVFIFDTDVSQPPYFPIPVLSSHQAGGFSSSYTWQLTHSYLQKQRGEYVPGFVDSFWHPNFHKKCSGAMEQDSLWLVVETPRPWLSLWKETESWCCFCLFSWCWAGGRCHMGILGQFSFTEILVKYFKTFLCIPSWQTLRTAPLQKLLG